MAGLTLQSELLTNATLVSNEFIDHYMCDANGEFVKIYLYLLRCVHVRPEQFSISFIADHINLTEKDVRRAFHYWEKCGLLALTENDQGEVLSLCLKSFQTSAALPPLSEESAATSEIELPAAEQLPVSNNEISVLSEEDRSDSSNSEISQLLFIAEAYLGKTLTSDEAMKICYFYDTLHFSMDLIEYLIEYCVSNGKKSLRYIETVAVSWAEKGIHTVSEAKEEGRFYTKEYFTILKAFGIRNRNPVTSEVNFMKKWLHSYHFEMNIIGEACSRTVTQLGNPSFPYADSILTSWHQRGVLTMKDIHALDHDYNRSQKQPSPSAAEASPNEKKTAPAVKNNTFNNFDQRSYDYDELEKQLSQLS